MSISKIGRRGPVTYNNGAYVAMANLSGPLQIGRDGPNWWQYGGALDEIRLRNVARTLKELQAGMSRELTGTLTIGGRLYGNARICTPNL